MLGGQKTEARSGLAELRYWDPGLTVERVMAVSLCFPRVWFENIADGLEATGCHVWSCVNQTRVAIEEALGFAASQRVLALGVHLCSVMCRLRWQRYSYRLRLLA